MIKRLDVDFLSGNMIRSLIIFAIPVFISSIFQQLYNTRDTIIVRHVLGENSLAAIGGCSSVYDLLVGFALGVGNGMSIVIAGYTETEFKLSQMIRYNLLTREEAIDQLESYYATMDNSIDNIIDLLESMDMEYLKDDVIKFYNNSKYFRKKY